MELYKKTNNETTHAHSTPNSPKLDPAYNPAYADYLRRTGKLKDKKPKKRKESFIGEVIRFSIIALIIVFPIRIFVAQPFIVSGASMEPTFQNGQYLIVDQITYRFEEPQRGDVIVFRYPRDPSKFFIKRVIGIPGDTLEIDGTAVKISNAEFPEGLVLNEVYVESMHPDAKLTVELGEGEYFVMGDNRDASSDSRVWGVLQENMIIGRALLRLLPVTDVGVLPGQYTAKEIEIITNTNY